MQFEFDFLRLKSIDVDRLLAPTALSSPKRRRSPVECSGFCVWRLFLIFHFYFGKIDGREMELFSSMFKPAVSRLHVNG